MFRCITGLRCLLPLGVLSLCALLCATAPACGSAAAADASEAGLWYRTGDDGHTRITLYFFWSQRCPHCQRARPFIEAVAAQRPWLELHSFELTESPYYGMLYEDLAAQVGGDARSVPAFIFCNAMWVGFDGPEGIGAQVVQALEACQRHLARTGSLAGFGTELAAPEALILPAIGRIDLGSLSLPLVTVLIAAVDAFNPCAFFVLLFLLSMLIHARSRVRMALVGGVFVLFSGLMYFLFMAAWLNFFRAFGHLQVITLVAGLVAVAIAVLNIKDYLWFKAGPSLSLSDGARAGLFARTRRLLSARALLPMLAAAAGLAIFANLYEFLCTAGFPMVYTRILTMEALPSAEFYLYLVLYNLVYVLPLVAIVVVFTVTLGARKLTETQGRTLKLLAGLMMLVLGGVLVFAPQLLNRAATAVAIVGLALVATGAIVWLRRRRSMPVE